jgi:hypothetical protein
VQWVGRRCCAAGYDGRAATRPSRLGNAPIIIGKGYQCLQEPFQILFWTVVFSFRQQTFTAINPDEHG